jgi:hypothetical protein
MVRFVQITPDPVAIGLSNLKLNVAQGMQIEIPTASPG